MPSQTLRDLFTINVAGNTQEQSDAYDAFLDSFVGTPEGDFLYSLYGDPFNNGGTKHDVLIDIISIDGLSSGWDPVLVKVNLDWIEFGRYDYEQKFALGSFADYSAERTLLHEIFHSLANAYYYDGQNIIDPTLNGEDVAIAFANHVMAKYYGEPERLAHWRSQDGIIINPIIQGPVPTPVSTSIYALTNFDPIDLDVSSDLLTASLTFENSITDQELTIKFTSESAGNKYYDSIVYELGATTTNWALEDYLYDYAVASAIYSEAFEAHIQNFKDLPSWIMAELGGVTVETRINDGVTLTSPELDDNNAPTSWMLLGGAGDDFLISNMVGDDTWTNGEQATVFIGGPGMDTFEIDDPIMNARTFYIVDGFDAGQLVLNGELVTSATVPFERVQGQQIGYKTADNKWGFAWAGDNHIVVFDFTFNPAIGQPVGNIYNFDQDAFNLDTPQPLSSMPFIYSAGENFFGDWSNPYIASEFTGIEPPPSGGGGLLAYIGNKSDAPLDFDGTVLSESLATQIREFDLAPEWSHHSQPNSDGLWQPHRIGRHLEAMMLDYDDAADGNQLQQPSELPGLDLEPPLFGTMIAVQGEFAFHSSGFDFEKFAQLT